MVGAGAAAAAAMEADEGGMARRLWKKLRKESVFALYTPFFVCLASGKLDPDAFRHFVSQDLHFFQAFAQAYEMAADCADDDDDRFAIRKLRQGVLEKLILHDTVVREWGFELPEESSPSDATVKYTEFLQAAASGKVKGESVPGKIATPFEKTKLAAYTLGSIAPFMRLYAVISNEIQTLLDPDDSSSHIYKKWIDSCSSKSFEASAQQIEDMLDQLSIYLTSDELEVIEKLYHQAMRLEVDFFSAQTLVQQTVVPLSRLHDTGEHHLTICCDFDLTCTAIDSSAFLAQIAIVEAQKADSNAKAQTATVEAQKDDSNAKAQTETVEAQKDDSNANESEPPLARTSSQDLRDTWDVLSKQYTKEYEECLESIISSTTTEDFNFDGLCEALEQFSDFEKRANARVVDSGVLKGLNVEDIKRASQCLILQHGCRGFFQKLEENKSMKIPVHVLSYCWSGDLIRSAFLSGDLNDLTVHSNELAYEESITTGEIIKKLESPMEKLQAFKDILKASRNEEKKSLTVYIGGTVGDLLCLLEADVGIVIGSSLSLRKLGNQFGISFVPLLPGLVKKQKELVAGESSNWKGQSGILYTVSRWAEIHAFILGS